MSTERFVPKHWIAVTFFPSLIRGEICGQPNGCWRFCAASRVPLVLSVLNWLPCLLFLQKQSQYCMQSVTESWMLTFWDLLWLHTTHSQPFHLQKLHLLVMSVLYSLRSYFCKVCLMFRWPCILFMVSHIGAVSAVCFDQLMSVIRHFLEQRSLEAVKMRLKKYY
jgi:hypothetical protein